MSQGFHLNLLSSMDCGRKTTAIKGWTTGMMRRRRGMKYDGMICCLVYAILSWNASICLTCCALARTPTVAHTGSL